MKKTLITPNGVKELELTTEEIAQKETDEANAKVELQKLKDAEEEKENKKATASVDGCKFINLNKYSL